MTEKRFKIYTDQIDHWTIVGLDLLQEEHTGHRLIVADIENILNNLYNENEELKKILKFLRNDNATDILNVLNLQEERIWDLKKENEQLQKKNDNLVNMIARVQYRADLIKEENEQLKQNCKNYKWYKQYKAVLNENEQLKKELESFKPIIFESDGKPVTLYKKGDVE